MKLTSIATTPVHYGSIHCQWAAGRLPGILGGHLPCYNIRLKHLVSHLSTGILKQCINKSLFNIVIAPGYIRPLSSHDFPLPQTMKCSVTYISLQDTYSHIQQLHRVLTVDSLVNTCPSKITGSTLGENDNTGTELVFA